MGLWLCLGIGMMTAGGDEGLGPLEIKTLTVAQESKPEQVVKYLFLPPKNLEAGKRYPLVLFLHGAGERGSDPAVVKVHFPEVMASESYREKFACFLLAPQCLEGKRWVEVDWSSRDALVMRKEPGTMMRGVLALLDDALKTLPVDQDRVYLTGLSMGGFGSWELAMRRPELFAAVAPICGGGDTKGAPKIAHLPIWAYHGAKDEAVPVERSREMIAALKEAGGSPKYTELPDVGHNSWTPAYRDPDGLMKWMFEQRKK